ncbi:hypothetical protein EF847_14290 [Actinobacteria bacterium YIM 96077]|uniref:Uncharacterized protein n=1 Tax=Phytoactinopolyspora halophila TaxID=1981511 RepID=A0A329QIT0_9ACTN|nr:hypothetical protein EF847_14290 [Actinobacteria bacterium YIM 96077]RAW11252.1 hypothetical protein DPM12_17200 [Phytoactinopolyspora halophila]
MFTALFLALALASPAQADAYRYWSYYQWSGGEWAFASAGPADTVPEDGAIEGWRHAIGDETSARMPRTGDVFADICDGASAGDGEKRVAVVIDYGVADDAPDGEEPPAPRGECAVVADDASGADVLAAVADVRLGDDGMTCGIDGYPETGCGGSVDGPVPSDDEETVELAMPDHSEDDAAGDASDDDGVPDVALIAGIAAVVAVGVAALVRMRRTRGE